MLWEQGEGCVTWLKIRPELTGSQIVKGFEDHGEALTFIPGHREPLKSWE